MKEINQLIGQRVKELQQSVKLSQAKMAAVVKTYQSAVARYEMGEAQISA